MAPGREEVRGDEGVDASVDAVKAACTSALLDGAL
jgi:hypothetical protein